MKTLPPDLELYNQTRTFTEANLPQALTQAHHTKPGIWGRIVVQSGSLKYCITSSGEEHTLDDKTPGVIEPEALHQIEPLGAVRFHIEFLR